jgi:hypothetical protein
MVAWGSLAAALGIDYWQHKRHKPTLCSTARRFLPPLAFVVSWGVLTGWLVDHYIDGFTVELDKLSD